MVKYKYVEKIGMGKGYIKNVSIITGQTKQEPMKKKSFQFIQYLSGEHL